ncbi:restriction endonuclease subunit S [uncultured Kordia sp.]|uniref:restriction endonuclease subunit S n=1 Tax=uncultured Kordia sp. TaxID=507699 RepID=UPI002626ED35|nr:restriction endonuclease subunit S [uncultured Kordia sp.]
MNKEKVKISSFLSERKDRFKPDVANKLGLKRVHKIDFSGNIHLVEHKPTRTNMILVKNGDLLISGINAEKGGVAIYEFSEDAIATIHYSSYTYDETKINIDYLKWFLKSNAFKQILIDQAGSGIKSELKPKRFLPLEINLPSLSEQIVILENLNSINSEAEELESLILENEVFLSKLRQSILQDAVQGKLTKEWRARKPTVEPANKLLKKIKIEKEQLIKEKKIKKEKPLPPISKEEIPFEIPKSWSFCRMGSVSDIQRGSSPRPKGDPRYFSNVKTNNHWISIKDISKYSENNRLLNTNEFLTDLGTKYSRYVDKGELIVAVSGSTTGKSCLTGIEGYIYDGLALIRIINSINSEFLLFYMLQLYNHMNDSKFGAAFPNINTQFLKEMIFQLPPVEEQIVIVEKVTQLLAYCDVLEQEIITSKTNAEKLMQSVLSKLLGEGNNVLVNKPTTKKQEKKPSRTIKYNSKTILMDLVKLLQENGKLHAEDLWKMSKYPNDIDAFYAELKRQIEEEEAIKESEEKGYLELA